MSGIIAFTQAKAKLSEILDRVKNGEEFVITRHDEMIAKLVPVQKPSFEEVKKTIEQLKALRKGVKISIDEIIAWKKKGQR
jgi:prevent-host-death family protein